MTSLQPLNDRCLIRRLDEPERIGSIIVPDVAKQRAIKGEIVAVGPGKWHPGEWWYVWRGEVAYYGLGEDRHPEKVMEWRWFEGYREVPTVYPGQTVYFNSKWNDVGEDFQHIGPLWDDKIHLVQVADIFATVDA